ncbi:hypothetical protein FHX41_1760 [Actinomadura hallensis]|uniref:Leucine rich repeat (LRR) protein n=1 Tax=Actinomadura hallensis TaxID=337895 RepID=A0A543IC08_9ACTN|nr:STM4015 family protein [Actinomadura hallensis]TQM68126.1 hypothetical protein FHX41_1760 [Actinomadura hallensis]
MSIHAHLHRYGGLRVVRFDDETKADGKFPPPDQAAWYVGTTFNGESFGDTFARFMKAVDTTRVTTLVIGYWGASHDRSCTYPVELLAEAADSFPALRALFLGDIVGEESEISWIEHSDITPLFTAFPGLESLEVRGASELRLEPVRSDRLQTLRFESGGLPAEVVRAVAASDLPNLRYLDMWLGEENYGGNATVADLAPLLSGERLPALRHLGLENSEIQDEIAAAVASAPVVARLKSLSLAMGALTDRGAEALLAGQPLTHLDVLDLRHHFLSDAMMQRVEAALPGVEVDLSDQQEPEDEDWFFIEVSE